MMIIDKIKNLFQKQDNILHCYTPNSAVYEFGEIEVAKKCLPSWWKELPSTYQHKPYVFQNSSSSNVFSQFKAPITTIKYCPAIQGLFGAGFIIKAWCDIKIFVSPEVYVDSIQKEDRMFNHHRPGSFHPYIQRAGFLPNMAHWKIPIDIFFSKEEAYAISSITMIKSFHDSLIGFLLSPKMRDDIVNGDQDAIKLLYSSMNRPSMPSSLSNLIMIKDNFPDFYKHITTKLDVMTVEEMKKYISNKSKE